MEKKNYEMMMIISRDTTEEKRADIIKKFSKMASTNTIVEKWGMKKFAYPIDYKSEGFYVLFHFQAGPEVIKQMTDAMNITEGVARYIFVIKDEKMLEADAKRRAMRAAARKTETTKQQEEQGE
ncbi:MAG: 30S ribosomal protein S6 [Firmicutes bacterium]|nr:30S ribosomal protein S6 [Bacillota bacterium]